MAQCDFLKDRVGVFDLKETDPNGSDFRSKSGINSLKYGMAYTPWLTTTFVKAYGYRSIRTAGILKKFDTVTPPVLSNTQLNALTTDAAVLLTIANLEKTMADVDRVGAATPILSTLKDQYNVRRNAYLSDKTVSNFTGLTDFLFDIARTLDTFTTGALALTNPDLINAVKLVSAV